MQVEDATDVVFAQRADLAPIYDNLVRSAIHTVKPDNVATFLGKKLTGFARLKVRPATTSTPVLKEPGSRKHQHGPVSIKMGYDKARHCPAHRDDRHRRVFLFNTTERCRTSRRHPERAEDQPA